MENSDIINTNEQCDSPVYVSSNVNSPVNSPVFVSKETEHESLTQFTEKLILPTLNDDLILSNTSHNNVTNVEEKNVSATTNVTSSSSNAVSVEHVSANTPEIMTETTTEMVTVVIKDFKYCQEEFLKQIKENNLSISAESVMRLLRIAMIIVEQTKESGSNKKDFVIKLLKDVVMNNTSMLTEHKMEALNLITGNIVSDSIDFIIDASRGKFDINKVEKVVEEIAKTCFARCWERISKKN
uniref:Uncharacterized protein n=1 Tax=viral metagenome TaxID=1070528 RepID=A0A6C0EYS0_9ZZZZ